MQKITDVNTKTNKDFNRRKSFKVNKIEVQTPDISYPD